MGISVLVEGLGSIPITVNSLACTLYTRTEPEVCERVAFSRHLFCDTGGVLQLQINGSMRSMRSMRGGFIFRNRGPSRAVFLVEEINHKHDSRFEHARRVSDLVNIMASSPLSC